MTSDGEQREKAQRLLASGDIPGLLRHLRPHSEALPLDEVARLVGQAAQLAAFDDLAQAAAALAEGGDGAGAENVDALYAYGYACVERGIGYLAVSPLARALELAPDATGVLSELVLALEGDGQHARAVTVLEEHEPLTRWPHRFLYVYNALMSGALEKAAQGFRRLPEPEDAAWTRAREKVRRMLARADIVRVAAPLDRQDLRGWHHVLTGGVLGSLSPYGFAAGMSGRWAYLEDSWEHCASALRRLKLILDAAAAAPESVEPLPDRSSRILGTAAAVTLGLPVTGFDPDAPTADSLVVAYDLTETKASAVAGLRERAPGQILFERVTRWTDPPSVTADVSGLLGQAVIAPWPTESNLLEDETTGRVPADDRPIETIAAQIVHATPVDDEGDGQTPPDLDDDLRRLVEAITSPGAHARSGGWLDGLREHIPASGPVPSSRFV